MPLAISGLRASAIGHGLEACQLFSGLTPLDLQTIAGIAVPKQLAEGY